MTWRNPPPTPPNTAVASVPQHTHKPTAPFDSQPNSNESPRMIESATTHGVQVEVESRFVPERSDADRGQYFFAYEIRITNTSAAKVQLVSRHWIITDGWGRVEEVKGPGVIGVQPWIAPGETFEYESFCPLSTPTGSMRGVYEMISAPLARTPYETDSAKSDWSSPGTGSNPVAPAPPGSFSAEIPQFFLVEPGSFH